MASSLWPISGRGFHQYPCGHIDDVNGPMVLSGCPAVSVATEEKGLHRINVFKSVGPKWLRPIEGLGELASANGLSKGIVRGQWGLAVQRERAGSVVSFGPGPRKASSETLWLLKPRPGGLARQHRSPQMARWPGPKGVSRPDSPGLRRPEGSVSRRRSLPKTGAFAAHDPPCDPGSSNSTSPCALAAPAGM